MEYNKIIIALLVVIVVMLVAGLAIINPFKEDVNLAIVSGNTLMDGDYLAITLTSANGTPVVNSVVNIKITDANGAENMQTITTDDKGKGQVQLNGLTPGTYNVTATYNGNGKYKEMTTSQNLNMQAAATSSNSQSESSSNVVSLDLTSFDTYVTKKVGDYEVKAMKWRGTTVGGLGVYVYKNGQMVDKNSYLSRGYICMDGKWKWTDWGTGGSGSNSYHKYPVSNGVIIEKVEVSL